MKSIEAIIEIVVVTFLRMNGEDIAVTDPQEIYSFVKDIPKCEYNEIEDWLKNGKLQEEESREGSGRSN